MNRNVAGTGQEFATYLSAIIIIVFGGWRVMEGALTLGSLAAFYAYVLAMWAPVRWMTFVNQMAQQAMAAGERVFEILDTPLDVAEKPDARRAAPAGRAPRVGRRLRSPTARSRPCCSDITCHGRAGADAGPGRARPGRARPP